MRFLPQLFFLFCYFNYTVRKLFLIEKYFSDSHNRPATILNNDWKQFKLTRLNVIWKKVSKINYLYIGLNKNFSLPRKTSNFLLIDCNKLLRQTLFLFRPIQNHMWFIKTANINIYLLFNFLLKQFSIFYFFNLSLLIRYAKYFHLFFILNLYKHLC